MRQIARVLLALAMTAIALCVPYAYAFNEEVTLDRSAGGTITATLSGFLYPCSYGFAGSPVVTISGNQISIVSHAVALGCPVAAGAQPFAFSQSATLGVLADGAYAFRWTQTDAAPTFQVNQPFALAAGLLAVAGPTPAPALSQWSVFLAILLVGYLGSRRWNPLRRFNN
jgi:hypothetical protein